MTWDTKLGPVTLIDILYTVAPVILASQILFSQQKPPKLLQWFAIGFCLAIANAFGVLSSFNEMDLKDILEIVVKSINVAAAFLLIPGFITDNRKLKLILLAILIGNIVPCGIGVYQASTGISWSDRMTVGLQRYNGLYHDAVGVRFNGQQALFAAMMLSSMFPLRKLWHKLVLAIYSLTWLVVIFNVFSKAALVTIFVWIWIWCIAQRKIAFLIILVLC